MAAEVVFYRHGGCKCEVEDDLYIIFFSDLTLSDKDTFSLMV